jgi:NAD(P)-dependent dehydrogenase (short-subunit alcohol dehydrogenase family)
MSDPVLLIVGARPNSLGSALYETAQGWPFGVVLTAGISGENFKLDITNSASMRETLDNVRPDYVVCTVGVNEMAPHDDQYLQVRMTDAFRTNVIGPMEMLRHFDATEYTGDLRRKFVAISSNSARIARTNSVAYCASKAALSMALRVAAREQARRVSVRERVLVWGYEPGLLNTAMTHEIDSRLAGPLHRMPGVEPSGLDPYNLADRILGDLMMKGVGLNGCLVQYDCGEQ